jgi:hypothetical protein
MRLPTHRSPTPPGEILLEEWLKPMKLTGRAAAAAVGPAAAAQKKRHHHSGHALVADKLKTNGVHRIDRKGQAHRPRIVGNAKRDDDVKGSKCQIRPDARCGHGELRGRWMPERAYG